MSAVSSKQRKQAF